MTSNVEYNGCSLEKLEYSSWYKKNEYNYRTITIAVFLLPFLSIRKPYKLIVIRSFLEEGSLETFTYATFVNKNNQLCSYIKYIVRDESYQNNRRVYQIHLKFY
jgi:hypothetical protein